MNAFKSQPERGMTSCNSLQTAVQQSTYLT